MPSCLQALGACAMAVKEASKLTLGGQTTLYTTHSVVHLMQNMSTQHMTAQRTSGYEVILFNTQHLDIKSCSETTPQVRFLHSLLHLSETDPIPQHDCNQQLLESTSPRSDLKDTPNPDYLHVFVDGSCTRPDDHTYKTGYSVVMLPDIILESKPLRVTSAQLLFEGQDVNVYTDSMWTLY